MKYCGIDFSINSTGICIYDTETEEFEFISIARKYIKKYVDTFLSAGISLIPHTFIKFDRTSEYTKLIDAKETTDLIMDVVSCCDIVAIEGLSFGSTGNSLAEISGCHYLLREKLYNKDIPFEVYPPKSIKKFAGNGNYSKDDLLVLFKTENTKVSKYFKDHNIELKKPIDDIVDAYYCVQFLKSFQS